MKPVCVPCRRFFRPYRNGVYFTEGMPIGRNVKPGLAEPERWSPYKIWAGDWWKREGCGAEILSGFGAHPVAEHFQDGFAEQQKALAADQLQVNDC